MRSQEEEIFLKAIRESPEDPLPQLVYADWLDERGDRRGEIIRLICEIQQDGTYFFTPAWNRLSSIFSPETRNALINRTEGFLEFTWQIKANSYMRECRRLFCLSVQHSYGFFSC